MSTCLERAGLVRYGLEGTVCVGSETFILNGRAEHLRSRGQMPKKCQSIPAAFR